ncbi:2652_t:CDS:2, partial [Funneliformis mosseae]
AALIIDELPAHGKILQRKQTYPDVTIITNSAVKEIFDNLYLPIIYETIYRGFSHFNEVDVFQFPYDRGSFNVVEEVGY